MGTQEKVVRGLIYPQDYFHGFIQFMPQYLGGITSSEFAGQRQQEMLHGR